MYSENLRRLAVTQTLVKTDVKNLPGVENQESNRILGEKENYKYLGILDADTIKQTEMKEKARKLLKT